MNDLFPQSQETFAEHSANENILRSWGEESLNNLVNALNKNPQVNIQISGNANFSYDKGFNGETPTMVNGEKRKISDLQIERAKAVKEFLIKRNISPNRLDINTGRIGPNSRSASIKIVK